MISTLMRIAALAAVTLAVLTSGAEAQEDSFRPPYNPRRTFVLVGVDRTSDPYNGDTLLSEAHSLLCIVPLELPEPKGLTPAAYQTPGGAMRNTWSGGKLFVVPLVEGTYLSSEQVADNLCYSYAKKNFAVYGARMAEFHDGDSKTWAGWAFWSEALLSPVHGRHTFDGRLWVKINDQPSNPWTTGGDWATALTFVKIAQQDEEFIFVLDTPNPTAISTGSFEKV